MYLYRYISDMHFGRISGDFRGIYVLNIIKRNSPNRNADRRGYIPDTIVCHITEGSFPGSIHWVTNPESKVSYHFMVSSDGEVTQCVAIEDTAWANGTTTDGGNRDAWHSLIARVRNRRVNANLYTVSIGFEGRHAEKRGALTMNQTTAAVQLIRHIRDEIKRIWGVSILFTLDNIIGHSDITPRHKPNCPGERFPFYEVIQLVKEMEEVDVRFNTVSEIPAGFLRENVQKWIRDGHLQGTGTNAGGEVQGLNLTEDMIRCVILAGRISVRPGCSPG